MSPSLEAAWRVYANGGAWPVPCSNPACREWHNTQAQADLEGLVFLIGGRSIAGETMNLCDACALKALTGRKPFKRKGLEVTVCL